MLDLGLVTYHYLDKVPVLMDMDNLTHHLTHGLTRCVRCDKIVLDKDREVKKVEKQRKYDCRI